MILLLTNRLTVHLIASTGLLQCDVARKFHTVLTFITPAAKPMQSSKNKFVSKMVAWNI